MVMSVARTVTASGLDVGSVVAQLVEGLRGEDLRLAVVFTDWRIDPSELARGLQAALPAPVVGCTTIGVIGSGDAPSAAAFGLYGDRVKVGIGIASDLPTSALAQARNAVHQAAAELGTTADALDSSRHVAITLVDGSCGHEEAFCMASAAAAPQIRYVGGSAATEHASTRRSYLWARGEVLVDAGMVILLQTTLPFEAVTSQHMIPTHVKTVVTAASGRTLLELDGRPAASRLVALVEQLGGRLEQSRPSEHAFARFVDGVPYLRSITSIDGERVHLACAVETGHVLRLMRSGDLIRKTESDLAQVATRVGGEIALFLAFSCIGRHWEASVRGTEGALARTYGAYPTIGFQSFGEQTGLLLVNHTLTGLAIGTQK